MTSPKIAQLGGVNLGTPDLEGSLKFFRDQLGMEVTHQANGIATLRGFQELTHHSLVLTEQEEALVNAYSLRAETAEDVAKWKTVLEDQGLKVLNVAAGAEPGRGEAIRFALPGGEHPFEIYYDIERPEAPQEIQSKLPSNSSTRRGLGVRRLDHINIHTGPETINQTEEWLRSTLGFKRREYIMHPKNDDVLIASWTSVTPQMHDVAFGMSDKGTKARLHHIAFNLQDFSDVLTAADVLRDQGVPFTAGPGKHGVGQAMYLYVHDPASDHRIELYAGGYLILEPDWEPIKWATKDIPLGITWYGAEIDGSQGSRGRQTTGSASVDWRGQ